MSDIVNYFQTHTFADLLLAIGVIIAIFKVGETIFGYIKKKLEAYHKKRNGEETIEEEISSHDKHIRELEILEEQNYEQLNNKIDKLVDTIDNMVDNSKKDMQVVLRDKVNYLYKKTLDKRYITTHDNKDYHYAVERYLANGGNSYVEDDIVPQMKQFKVFTSDEEAEKYFATHKE